MKSILIYSAFLFCVAGCKKNSSAAPKDYLAAISDKTWSGAITYTGDSIQYYSIHFNADYSLLWSQFAGDYPGNWGLSGNLLTITFAGSNAVIRAGIADDDQLVDITVDNTNSYMVNSGKLLTNPAIALESTVWNGSGYFAVAHYPYQMSFLPGSRVQIKIQGTVYPLYNYTRSASGAAIRFTASAGVQYFGVITSDNEIKGSVGDSNNPWQTIKQ